MLEHNHTMEFAVTLLLHILPFPPYFLSHLENVIDESYDTQRKLASNHIEIEGLYMRYVWQLYPLPSSENYYFLVNPAETITTNHFTVTTKRKENRKMELGDVITTVIRGQLMVTHPIKELHLRKLSLRKVEPDENFSKILEN